MNGDGMFHADVRLTLLGGEPILVGGLEYRDSSELEPVADVREWDREAGGIVTTRQLLQPRSYHSTFAMPDGRALVFGGIGHLFGGEGESHFTQEIEVLHPDGSPNESFGRLQEIRFHPMAHLEPEGTVLIFGGSFVVFAPAFERVDLVARTVTPLHADITRMYTNDCAPSLAPLQDGTYFLIGGMQQVAPGENRYRCGGGAEIVDLETGAARFVGDDIWQIVAAGRRALALPDGDVLVIGSRDATTGGPWIERFDAASEVFSTVAEGDVPILHPAVLPLADGRIFIIGNDHRDPHVSVEELSATWFFDPASETLAAGPPLPGLFNKPQAALLDDGAVFVLGNPLGHDDGLSLLHLAVLE